jgi:hypothetical protein
LNLETHLGKTSVVLVNTPEEVTLNESASSLVPLTATLQQVRMVIRTSSRTLNIDAIGRKRENWLDAK